MGLVIKDLSYSYTKDKLVLDSVSLSLDEGKCVGVIGKNGVGKTTLMKCIIKLLRVGNDKIFLDGVDINTLSNKKRAQIISYVPQDINLPATNVFDAILIGRMPYMKMDASREDLEAVEAIIKELNLEEMAFKRVNELSGGQRQKVAIARALVQEPRLLYLDEPTSNLDLKNQVEVIKTIRRVAKSHNKLVIMNIQDVNLALSYLDEVVILNDSRVLYSGSVDGLNSYILHEALGVNLEILDIDGRRISYIREDD